MHATDVDYSAEDCIYKKELNYYIGLLKLEIQARYLAPSLVLNFV